MRNSSLKILALDTSTEACSAALWLDGEVLERYQVAPRAHASLVLGMIDSLLRERGLTLKQLDTVAFGRGPGAFTGVRIATGVVQGIAFGAELPVVPVSTLAALAQGVVDREGHPNVLSAIDARMGEIYWGVYRVDGYGCARAVAEEWVAPAEEVFIPEVGEWWGVGTGWDPYGEVLAARLEGRLVGHAAQRYPRAGGIAKLAALDFENGLAVSAEQALPVYLRDNVVHAR